MAKFSCPTFSSELEISLDAIRANYRAIGDHAPNSLCGAVVKADAYGLGARRVAMALYEEGCRIYFVAQLAEALDLHAVLPLQSTLIILNGLDPGGEAICADQGFTPVLNSVSQVERWRAAASARQRRLPACLNVETGMSRLGLPAAELESLAEDPSFAEQIDLRMVMTHLACADEPDAAANREQLERFNRMAQLFPGVPRSIANSCGTTLSECYHLEIVRAGIALYGVTMRSKCLGISPVVGLRARIIQIRDLEAGSGVGYGLSYRAAEPRRLATLAVGYADGWPRALSNVGAAWHRDVRLPIVGRISMDTMTVDISNVSPGDLLEGDMVDLVGPRQTLEDVAADADTIAYEILTRLGARHARIFTDDRAVVRQRAGQAA